MLGITVRQFKSLVRNGRFPLPVEHTGEGGKLDLRVSRWLVLDVDSYVHLASRPFQRQKPAQAEQPTKKKSDGDK